MIIGRMLSPVHSLGPGERVCLWTQGCSKNCVGCISPELQPPVGVDVPPRKLAQILSRVAVNCQCTGLTISGGDPFEQPAELLTLLQCVRGVFDDILVYTGYQLAEIAGGCAEEAGKQCLSYIDVLIDGRYEKKRNTPDCILRGSHNQVIHFLNVDKKESYTEYMKRGRIVESFVHGNKTIITGILNEEDGQ